MRIALVIIFLLLINFDNAFSAGNQSDQTEEPTTASLEHLPPEIIQHIMNHMAKDAAKQSQDRQAIFNAGQDADVEAYRRIYEELHYMRSGLPNPYIVRKIRELKLFQYSKNYPRKIIDIITSEATIIKSMHALHQTCKSLNQISTPFIKKHWEAIRIIKKQHWNTLRAICTVYNPDDEYLGVYSEGNALLIAAVRKSNLDHINDSIKDDVSPNEPNYYLLDIASKTINTVKSYALTSCKIGIPLIMSALLYTWWEYNSNASGDADGRATS